MHRFLLSGLRRHPLFDALFTLRGNAKYCVYSEPLWGIPYNLFAPFVTVYMYSLGVGDVQIGLIISVTMALQVIMSLMSGIITDKMGRRMATLVFDIIAWSIPCLIWAFSRNIWWFLAAGVFNSAWQVTNNSWTCLLVEEAPRDQMMPIYTWVSISGRLSVFFAPLSGLLIRWLDVVTTVRILYLFSFVFMSAKFIVLFIFSKETEQGLVRMRETKGVPVVRMLGDYKSVLSGVLQTPQTLRLLLLLVMLTVMQFVLDNFFALYVSNDLRLPTQYLAYFPIIRAAIMLVFYLGPQHRIMRLYFKLPMLAGLAIFILCHIVLICTPPGSLSVLLLYVALEPVAFALFMPWKDSLVALNIDPEKRAGIIGVMNALMLLGSSPFGYIAGLLSSLDRRLPFVLNIFLFLCMGILILTFQERPQASEEA